MTLNIANLDRLISHLERLPEEKFDMRELFDGPELFDSFKVPLYNECGTVACVAGHCAWAAKIPIGDPWTSEHAAEWLGLEWYHEQQLFVPSGYWEGIALYPLSRAIRTLKHMRSEWLRTGEVVVDWDAPEPAPLKAWAAPQAVEQKLPAELTRLLGSPVYSEVL